MTDHTINVQRNGEQGRYVIVLNDGAEAEMTFTRRGDIMRINHTGVPEQWEGHGLARQLLDRAIADARAEGLKILPACSYVIAQFKRHADEWKDVVAG